VQRFVLLWIVLGLMGCGDRPWFESVLLPRDTADTLGPYIAEAWVVADEGVFRFVAEVATQRDVPQSLDLPLERVDGDAEHGLWRLELPGRPAGSLFVYTLKVVDDEGNIERHPESGAHELSILPP
jgi:hypothetical protein